MKAIQEMSDTELNDVQGGILGYVGMRIYEFYEESVGRSNEYHRNANQGESFADFFSRAFSGRDSAK